MRANPRCSSPSRISLRRHPDYDRSHARGDFPLACKRNSTDKHRGLRVPCQARARAGRQGVLPLAWEARALTAPSCSQCPDRPAVGDAFELVFAAVREGEFAADDEFFDRARDENLAGPGKASNACRKGDSQSGDVVAATFDFAGMYAGAL